MRGKKVMAGMYVLAAGLLLALGATARHVESGPREAAPVRSTAQMSGHMGRKITNRNLAAAREHMQTILDKLVENHRAMTRAKNPAAMKPLLAVEYTLLERMRNEMNRTWGMHRHSMSGRHHALPKARTIRRSATRPGSAKENKLVARGRHLFNVDSCRVCHGPTAHGTSMAPSLIGVGKKYSPEKIAHLIRHPVTPKMPSFSKNAISDADLKAVIGFLETLK